MTTLRQVAHARWILAGVDGHGHRAGLDEEALAWPTKPNAVSAAVGLRLRPLDALGLQGSATTAVQRSACDICIRHAQCGFQRRGMWELRFVDRA